MSRAAVRNVPNDASVCISSRITRKYNHMLYQKIEFTKKSYLNLRMQKQKKLQWTEEHINCIDDSGSQATYNGETKILLFGYGRRKCVRRRISEELWRTLLVLWFFQACHQTV